MVTPKRISEEWELKAPTVKTAFNRHAEGPLQQFFDHGALFVRPLVC
jgi:hypothetical protein